MGIKIFLIDIELSGTLSDPAIGTTGLLKFSIMNESTGKNGNIPNLLIDIFSYLLCCLGHFFLGFIDQLTTVVQIHKKSEQEKRDQNHAGEGNKIIDGQFMNS
jgi:hypothetical protein